MTYLIVESDLHSSISSQVIKAISGSRTFIEKAFESLVDSYKQAEVSSVIVTLREYQSPAFTERIDVEYDALRDTTIIKSETI